MASSKPSTSSLPSTTLPVFELNKHNNQTNLFLDKKFEQVFFELILEKNIKNNF